MLLVAYHHLSPAQGRSLAPTLIDEATDVQRRVRKGKEMGLHRVAVMKPRLHMN